MSLRLNKIIRMAESHLKAGEFSQAEQLFRDILHKFPKNKKAIAGYLKIRAGITNKDPSNSEPPHDQLQVLVNLFNNNLAVQYAIGLAVAHCGHDLVIRGSW